MTTGHATMGSFAMTAAVVGLGLTLTAHPASACGLKDVSMPVGTPIQEITISGRDRPTMGFGSVRSAVTSASIVDRPCHGTLTRYQVLGFRYIPDSGYAGTDMFAIRGCLGPGRCNVTGAAITVRQ